MTYKYKLPCDFVEKVSYMREFANGGAQVTILTKDDKIYRNVLISNSTYIIAMRGYKDLPFKIEDIKDIYQTEEDIDPKEHGNWYFWDD